MDIYVFLILSEAYFEFVSGRRDSCQESMVARNCVVYLSRVVLVCDDTIKLVYYNPSCHMSSTISLQLEPFFDSLRPHELRVLYITENGGEHYSRSQFWETIAHCHMCSIFKVTSSILNKAIAGAEKRAKALYNMRRHYDLLRSLQIASEARGVIEINKERVEQR